MLDLRDARLQVTALEKRLHLYQIPKSIELPVELRLPDQEDVFYSITYAPSEVSVVTPVLAVSDTVMHLKLDGTIKYAGPWSCLKVRGPMDLTMTGVMSELTAPLAKSHIAIFALSTYNTDFILVHDEDRLRAINTLRTEGWTVDDLG